MYLRNTSKTNYSIIDGQIIFYFTFTSLKEVPDLGLDAVPASTGVCVRVTSKVLLEGLCKTVLLAALGLIEQDCHHIC